MVVKGVHQQEADKVRNPIYFEEEHHPIYFQEDELNGTKRFAITRTTENGKYVTGGMLTFRINGVEIYTDIENIIFVDLRNNTAFIKNHEKVNSEIAPADPATRQYILMLTINDDYADDKYTWESITGRDNVYEFIKTNYDILSFDPDKSIVLTENVAVKDAITIRQFIEYLKNGDLIPEDDFVFD